MLWTKTIWKVPDFFLCRCCFCSRCCCCCCWCLLLSTEWRGVNILVVLLYKGQYTRGLQDPKLGGQGKQTQGDPRYIKEALSYFLLLNKNLTKGVCTTQRKYKITGDLKVSTTLRAWLPKLTWLVGNCLMLCQVYGYYEQSW